MWASRRRRRSPVSCCGCSTRGSAGRSAGSPSRSRSGRDGWSYLRRFAARSDAVTAPSSHFAQQLEQHEVVPGARSAGGRCGVERDRRRRAGRRARLGLARANAGAAALRVDRADEPREAAAPFLEALAESGVRADVEVIGGGGELRAARRIIEKRRPAASVVFAGRMPYAEALRRHPGRGRGRADLDRLRDPGDDGLRGRVARHPVRGQRPRRRRRARRGPLGCRGRLGVGARRDPAPCGRRHRGRHRADARPDGARAVPPVLADGGDARGLPPGHGDA